MTYDQRVAEQPPVANETGTYTYNIEWNDKVKTIRMCRLERVIYRVMDI